MRLIYLSIGWLAVGIAVLGAFLPILPTVPFLLIALLLEWFAKWLVILALALTGYMWWTGHPTFERYAGNAKNTRNELCRDAQGAFPDAPVSDYLCP